MYALAFGATFCGVALVRAYALQRNLLDVPNARSSHTLPTPRGGGVAFVIIWLLCIVSTDFMPLEYQELILPGAAMIAAVSFIDDHRGLGAKQRLLWQAIAASYFVTMLDLASLQGVLGVPWWLSAPVLVFACLWSTNLFNFMDGTDGLTSIQALFVFGMGGWLFAQAGAYALFSSCLLLCACIAGFLCWNWPRARIFMGDVGSTFLGFLIAVFAIIGQVRYGISVLYWGILYGAFWMDASITLIRRIIGGEPWTKPHKTHAYQRLHQAGWSHLQLLLGLIGLNTGLSALVYAATELPAFLSWACGISIVLLLGIAAAIEYKNPRQPSQ